MVVDPLPGDPCPFPTGDTKKIMVTDVVIGEGPAILSADPPLTCEVLGLSKPDLLACVGDYNVVITRYSTTVDKAQFDAATRPKIVARAGVGTDTCGCGLRQFKGVIVVNAPFGNTHSVAEHTPAMLLLSYVDRPGVIGRSAPSWAATRSTSPSGALVDGSGV